MLVKAIALIFVATMLAACSDDAGAKKALAAQGYTNITINGYSWWGCDQHDAFRTAFKAIGPTGVAVTGVVCSSWVKGSTVRTF